MTTLAQRREFSPQFGQQVTVTKTGMAIADTVTYADWENLGQQLAEVGDSTAWWIADWLRSGERVHGKTYRDAAEITGLDPGTLKNYAYVAGIFDPSHRCDGCSFAHHYAVAGHGLEAATAWLTLAANQRWSVREMLKEIGAGMRELLGPQDDTSITLERLTLTVPEDRAERWKHAADEAGLSFQEWCATTLDEAAA